MKKSRIAKISLMGASIAALAATLTTSTYAWYVSNKQADITNGSGTTGTAGSDGSVTLSWDNVETHYFKTLDFTEDSDAVKNALKPVHYCTTSDYIYSKVASPTGNPSTSSYYEYSTGAYSASTDTTVNAAKTYYTRSAAATAGFYDPAGTIISTAVAKTYIQFEVYVKTGDGSTVTPTINLTTSNPGTATPQSLYVADGLPSTKSAGQTMLIDAKYALYVQQVVDGGDTTYFEVDDTSSAATLTDGNAHDYYNAVNGNAPWCVEAATAAGLGQIATTANVGKKVTYTIFLDGGDTDCFNSCCGWNITFNLEFKIS